MSRDGLDKIIKSVLYEGYMLYPYRRSALKNQHRWNFGLVYPDGMSPSQMRTECLLQGNSESRADVEVRFLQLHERDSWQEAVERTLHVVNTGIHKFQFDAIEGDIEVVREVLERRL